MNRPYAMARRSFLRSVGASSVGLPALLRSLEAGAAGAPTPQRFMVIHRPVGTVRSQWIPQGGPSGLILSPILAPFAPFRSQMVVLDGLQIITAGDKAAAGAHEGGLVTVVTGAPLGGVRRGDDAINTGPSIDQILAAGSASLAGAAFKSIQLAADDRDEEGDVSSRRLSYAPGKDTPFQPELDPLKAYERLFGSMLPGGDTPANAEQLKRARARRKSVLDFMRRDLARLQTLAPASQRTKIDAHAAAIRELETSFDQALQQAGCFPGAAPPSLPTNTSESHEMVGKMHLAVTKAAFACDRTRVATFQWAAGASKVVFQGLFDGMPPTAHHAKSHESGSDVEPILAAVDKWYAERTAAFLLDLKNTRDAGGAALLDNTLVVYLSEVANGGHGYSDIPFALFGGPGVRLDGGRLLTFGRPINDLWLAIAPVFGVSLPSLGDQSQHTGPLPGIFV